MKNKKEKGRLEESQPGWDVCGAGGAWASVVRGGRSPKTPALCRRGARVAVPGPVPQVTLAQEPGSISTFRCFPQQPYDYTVIMMTLLLGTANSTIIKKFISKSSWKLINFTAVSILSHCNKEKLSSRQIKSKLIALGESIQISLFHVRNLFLKQEEESQGEPAQE